MTSLQNILPEIVADCSTPCSTFPFRMILGSCALCLAGYMLLWKEGRRGGSCRRRVSLGCSRTKSHQARRQAEEKRREEYSLSVDRVKGGKRKVKQLRPSANQEGARDASANHGAGGEKMLCAQKVKPVGAKAFNTSRFFWALFL